MLKSEIESNVGLKKGRLNSLQLLRGLAALFVTLSHVAQYASLLGHSSIATFYSLRTFGVVGVDVFFIVSGAVMVIVTHKKNLNGFVFLKKRAIRILPLYWLISLLSFVLHISQNNGHFNWLKLYKTITILPIFDTTNFILPILTPGWTLSFEVLFYFILAIALFLKRGSIISISCFIIAFLVVMGFLFPTIKNVQFVFITNPIILEFLIGCFCGWLYVSNIKFKNGFLYGALLIGILILIANIVFGFGEVYSLPNTLNANVSFERVIKWGIGCFLCTMGLVLLEKNGKLRVDRLFIFLGNISFALYLINIPIFVIVIKLALVAQFKHPDLFILADMFACILVAYFIHEYVELPLMYFFNKLFATKSSQII